jgi:diacylglycerol kinase family enzyme
VIPLGTFNYFARSLELPEELPEAVAVVAEGAPRPVRIGEVNGKIFLNNASLGAYPAILERREQVYRKWGRSRIAAYWSVLSTLVRLKARLQLTVSADGETRAFRTPLAFVANNPYQLEMVGLDGADCVSAGHLALFIAPDSSRLGMLAHALRLAGGATSPDRDFELLCGDEIRMETKRRRLLVARDGERARLDGPFSFRVRHDALRVLLPQASG